MVTPASDTLASTLPLALDAEEFRRLAHGAVDLAADHLAGIGGRPVFTPMAADERLRLMEQVLPDRPTNPDVILDLFSQAVLSHPMGNGHPRFFGWVNSPPAPLGIIADFLAAAMNPSCAGGDHAAIYVERAAMRWLMELVGFPTDGAIGLLVSGGSMASLTALAAARHWAAAIDGWDVRQEGLSGGRPPLVLYLSEEGHSCMRKAAELLGLGAAAICAVPVDGNARMDVDALRRSVVSDRAAGLRPFCVGASAGTVGTGAIDPLDAIAEVCADHGLWLHVDGAYGALGVLDPEIAPRYTGLAHADSLALDPHKWLSVPVECGAIIVRHGQRLRDAFSLVPHYLQTEEGKGFGGLPWFSEYGFQQTRGFRALKLWMVLQQMGRSGIAGLVSRHLDLARRLASLVEAAPDLELLAPVTLSIVCFRFVPEAARGDEVTLDRLNKAIMEAVQSSGEAFLSNTLIRGRFALRACVLNYSTNDRDIAALVDVVLRVGAGLARRAPTSRT